MTFLKSAITIGAFVITITIIDLSIQKAKMSLESCFHLLDIITNSIVKKRSNHVNKFLGLESQPSIRFHSCLNFHECFARTCLLLSIWSMDESPNPYFQNLYNMCFKNTTVGFSLKTALPAWLMTHSLFFAPTGMAAPVRRDKWKRFFGG